MSKTILAIFSHPDDELGVVGTLFNHSRAGDKVYLAFLTYGENASTIIGSAPTIKERRIEHANKVGKLLNADIRFIGFPDSRIEYTVENAYKIAELIKEVRPNIIVSWNKVKRFGAGHPDHRHTSELVYDAINYARYKSDTSQFEVFREPISYYTYYDPLDYQKGQVVYIDVSDTEEVINKFIEIYKEAYGDWPVRDYKFGTLSYFGRRARVKYAEVFERILYHDECISKTLT